MSLSKKAQKENTNVQKCNEMLGCNRMCVPRIFMKKYAILFLIFSLLISCKLYSETTGPSQETAPKDHVSKNYFDIKVDDKEGDRFFSEFINMLTTLGILVAIILIATWFLKKMVHGRMQQLNTTSEIKIIEKRLLTPKTSLYLVDIKGKGFILAESMNGVTSLGSYNIEEMENLPKKPTFKEII